MQHATVTEMGNPSPSAQARGLPEATSRRWQTPHLIALDPPNQKTTIIVLASTLTTTHPLHDLPQIQHYKHGTPKGEATPTTLLPSSLWILHFALGT
jgi:hypothetical protein